MKPEKLQLIDDLIGDDTRRESTLLAAARIMGRRRQWRAARQTAAFITLLAVALFAMKERNQRLMTAQVSAPKAIMQTQKQPQALTDEQLLSLFPDTPVGLATLPNGKKLLIFPRPADQAKFVARL